MATDRTPTHKRISRAEAGRDEWRGKAIERREESERLKRELASKNAALELLDCKYKELQEQLKQAVENLSRKEEEVEVLKKKHFR